MTLSFTLNEEAFNGLESHMQGLYTKQDDGSYQLAIDGLPNTDGLKAKNEQLLGETKKEREKRKELEAQLAQIQAQKQKADEESHKKNGDIEALEKSYQAKLDKLNHDANHREQALKKQIYDLTVGQAANNLANELAIKGSANVLLPHIQNRLTLETSDDGQKIRVLDLQGNISALTLDELKQEFMANDAFKPLIAGNSASGGGAVGVNLGVRAVPKTLAECKTDDERIAWLNNQHGA